MAQSNSESKVKELRESVASVIRMARADKQLSQIEVAQKARTSPSRVSELENGSADPRLSTLARIAGVLGVRVKVSTEDAA